MSPALPRRSELPPSETEKLSCKPAYRLSRINVKASEGVDQIKFTYDDGEFWTAGHDSGKDCRVAIMTKGEYLVSITHERLINNACAAAGVVFETNKGRTFSYQPRSLATRLKSEQVTFRAEPGHEIITLDIRLGVLTGIGQQPVPSAEEAESVPPAKQWYSVLCFGLKEDKDVTCWHFHSKREALAKWKVTKAFAESKLGRAAVLLNTKNLSLTKKIGEDSSVETLLNYAQKEGLCHTTEGDEDPGVVRTVMMLFKLLGDKSDLRSFAVVLTTLMISQWLDLSANLLTGQVLTSMTLKSPDQFESHWAVDKLCECTTTCDDTMANKRYAVILAFLILKLAQNVFYVANVFIHHNACEKKNTSLKIKSFAHVLYMDQSFYDTKSVSEIRQAMDAHSLNNLISWNIPYIMTLSLKVMMIFYFMFTLHVRLATTTLAIFCCIKFGILDVICERQRIHAKLRSKIELLNDQNESETFNMMASVKLFSKEKHHIKQFKQGMSQLYQAITTEVNYRCVGEFCRDSARTVAFCVVLLQSSCYLDDPSLTASSLTSFFLLFQEVMQLFHRISWHYQLLNREFGDIDRFLALMEKKPRIVSGDDKPAEISGEVEFKNVNFNYPSRPVEEVLQDLNLKITPKKTTAIVGDSGAGKSTIAKLVMRLYDPKAGAVILDGQNLQDLDLAHLHDQVAVVSQTPELYNSSIYDNIAYGAPGQETPTPEQVYAAAKLARCHDFIMSFRSGYNTFAGAGGAQLSGGQKQRISIARAALRNPKVLILDEATSALDADNEQAVQEALNSIMKGKTTVIIAHRLCTIKSADEVVCMHKGKVVERGTHDELMAIRGSYYNLVSKQMMGDGAAK